MIVTPKMDHYGWRSEQFGLDPASVKVIPSDNDELFLECEVQTPPSQAGRTVYVRVPVEQVPALMKAAKRAAIRTRTQKKERVV